MKSCFICGTAMDNPPYFQYPSCEVDIDFNRGKGGTVTFSICGGCHYLILSTKIKEKFAKYCEFKPIEEVQE